MRDQRLEIHIDQAGDLGRWKVLLRANIKSAEGGRILVILATQPHPSLSRH